jgi:hypothetical protein
MNIPLLSWQYEFPSFVSRRCQRHRAQRRIVRWLANVELENICKGTDVNVSMYFPNIKGDAHRGTEENQNSFSPADIRTKFLPIVTLERYRSTGLRSRSSKITGQTPYQNSLNEKMWTITKVAMIKKILPQCQFVHHKSHLGYLLLNARSAQ